MTEFEQELQQLLDRVERKRYLDKMIEQLEPQREQLRQKCAQLQSEMYKEDRDVTSLEGNSVAGFFLDIFGKREERLEKERQEAYSARMKYNTATYELDSVERIIEKHEKELDGLQNSEAELQTVLDTHSAQIGTESRIALQVQLSLLKGKKLELDEAVTAGNKVVESTHVILTYLDKADDWSTADFFMDNILVDIAKHDNIDKAAAEISNIQTLLDRFRSELADVSIDRHIDISIDSFTSFADFFWDDIFSNLAVQEKITAAIKQVENIKYQVQNTISTLIQLTNENSRQQQQVEEKIRNLK